jgi:hypothetical protein
MIPKGAVGNLSKFGSAHFADELQVAELNVTKSVDATATTCRTTVSIRRLSFGAVLQLPTWYNGPSLCGVLIIRRDGHRLIPSRNVTRRLCLVIQVLRARVQNAQWLVGGHHAKVAFTGGTFVAEMRELFSDRIPSRVSSRAAAVAAVAQNGHYVSTR